MAGCFWLIYSCAQRQVDSKRKTPATACLHVPRMGGVLGTPNAIRAAWEAYSCTPSADAKRAVCMPACQCPGDPVAALGCRVKVSLPCSSLVVSEAAMSCQKLPLVCLSQSACWQRPCVLYAVSCFPAGWVFRYWYPQLSRLLEPPTGVLVVVSSLAAHGVVGKAGCAGSWVVCFSNGVLWSQV